MPIKPENRHRYPPEWPEIRLQVLQRAGYRCEWPGCRAQHHALGRWVLTLAGHIFKPASGDYLLDLAGRAELPYRQARMLAQYDGAEMRDEPLLVIVLTVAHLDHTPEHCDLANLRAWCQRHHLAYDQDHHRQTAYMSRLASRQTLPLFPEGAPT